MNSIKVEPGVGMLGCWQIIWVIGGHLACKKPAKEFPRGSSLWNNHTAVGWLKTQVSTCSCNRFKWQAYNYINTKLPLTQPIELTAGQMPF